MQVATQTGHLLQKVALTAWALLPPTSLSILGSPLWCPGLHLRLALGGGALPLQATFTSHCCLPQQGSILPLSLLPVPLPVPLLAASRAASSCTQPSLHHRWAAPTIASLLFPNSSSRHLPPRSTFSNIRLQVLLKTTWAFGSCLSHGSPPALHLLCQTLDSRYPKPPGTLLQASVQFPLRVAASELSQPKC